MEIFCDTQINDPMYDWVICSKDFFVIQFMTWNFPDQ